MSDTRMRASPAVVAVIAILPLTAGVAAAEPTKTEAFLASLPAAVGAAKTIEEVRGVLKRAPADVAFVDELIAGAAEARIVLHVTFPVRDALWLDKAWYLDWPYALAVDVHQHSWVIELYAHDIADKYGKRIATKQIAFGKWIIQPRLEGRPKGELPGVSAGASPAYDLGKYPARVVAIDIIEPRS